MSHDSATEYGLSFGGDAVHLQKRERPLEATDRARQPAWRHLGSVDFDEPDFREVLVNLRMMATGQGADVLMPVTLIIPDDQILYTTLTVPPSGDRDWAVARALDGLTPYAIDELAFDWRGESDSVRVAAVARQTLREAREFALQYGFDGEAYCADPEGELFPGEPVFEPDPAPRHRPVVDPGSAGVTASELMIEEEPSEPTPVVVAPPPIVAADPAPEAEPEVLAEAPVEADTIAPETVELTPADPEHEARVLEAAAALAATQDHAPTEAEVKVPPVVRHAPARPAPIPPAPTPVAAPSPMLNARARAVHRRAAEARQAKPTAAAAPAPAPAPAAPTRAPAPPQRRRSVGMLTAMLATLLVGLVLIWAFIVPEARPAQIAATPDPLPIVTVNAPAPEPEPAPPQTMPVIEETVTPAPVAPAPPAAPEAPAPVAAAPNPVEPGPQTAPVGKQVTLADMPPERARRVLVAASATAAAVVSSGSSEPSKAQPAPQPTSQPVAEPAAQPETPAAVAEVPAPQKRPGTAPATAAAQPAAPAATRVTNSARPQLSPRRSTPQTTEPRVDTAPRVPESPLPYTATQKSGQPLNSSRPPQRKRVDRSGATQTAPATRESASAEGATRSMPAAGRPPQRPEGSAPDLIDDADLLDPAEQRQLDALILDLRSQGLVAAKPVPRDFGPRFADARPKRKPAGAKPVSDAVSPAAVEEALRSASNASPARNSGGLLNGSSRPSARPDGRPGGRASTAPISDEAVEKAIAAAVDASPAIPNATKLASSPLPPRRSGGASAPAEAEDDDKPEAPAAAAAAAVAAPAAGPSEAELAARRALDEQLQAQAEARIRARAQADAAAEAQARAQAEARARAQAEAEERAARAQKQVYKPQEIDDEPEVAANVPRGGSTSASVASNATQRRAMDTGRTTIIGIIGAGNASRALIRLRNGKVVTVRLGDKIDGGTINSIGNGKLTYVKAGRQRELRLLDGR
ncbi:hypothetical protein ACEUZ9_004312 [Paracoccus litorisediminis]|uniref:Translation initiation factor 2 n=1 Tax=Paracoccus litorisediminis TaxID=2006130 RepID=A0A844HQ70_9RHOB|nr:hypothetical protein [Paracoccus litorisediminis]MTH59772.1 hypothetical protein [Paracoccus litorisediminis]